MLSTSLPRPVGTAALGFPSVEFGVRPAGVEVTTSPRGGGNGELLAYRAVGRPAGQAAGLHAGPGEIERMLIAHLCELMREGVHWHQSRTSGAGSVQPFFAAGAIGLKENAHEAAIPRNGSPAMRQQQDRHWKWRYDRLGGPNDFAPLALVGVIDGGRGQG